MGVCVCVFVLKAVFITECSMCIFTVPHYPNREVEYCDECVCVSVCVIAYFSNHTFRLHGIFDECCLLVWLSLPLAMLG